MNIINANGLHAMLGRARQSNFADSPQWNLGALIDAIASCPMADECWITFDWAFCKPGRIQSWRGSYDELAINWVQEGDYYAKSAHEFLEELKECDGKTYTGYKGGDFTMSRETPLWVSNYSETGNTQVVGITAMESASGGVWHVVINTAYGEY